MSALPLSKKKRIIRIIIILSALVETKLLADIEGSVYETILDQIGEAKTLVFDEDESLWNAGQQDAWDAIEAIMDAFDPANVNDPTEQELETLSATLGDALTRC